MNDPQLWKFTCKTCGGHSLTVTHTWNVLAGNDSETWQEWGPLEADHLWHYNYKEKIEKEDVEVERGDFGEFAEDDSDSEPGEYEAVEQESDPESDEFYVNCAYCDREIKFGWSQLDRHGLIFPVELSDFDPLESWPDPKYVNVWQQKGWLRAGHLQVETNIPKILS
jgi:hypothetical protein